MKRKYSSIRRVRLNIIICFIFFREKDVDLGQDRMNVVKIDEIENVGDILVLHKAVNHENLHGRRKSVASLEVDLKAGTGDMVILLAVIVETNGMIKRNDAKTKSRAGVYRKNLRANWSGCLKRNQVNATMMPKSESAQKIHLKENHPMMLPKKIWT